MAALPSPIQVAGHHIAVYEAYYHQVDPRGTGIIQAVDAARFLKKSHLSDVVLSKIWDLSDPGGRGYLDKSGLFTALKLVALAQAGLDYNMNNIYTDTPPPKVGDMPKPAPAHPPPPSHSPAPISDWSIKPTERDQYNCLFDTLQPRNGLIPGNKVKGVLMESRLPTDTLGKIWDLADQDKDGMLDRHEFTVAMHLVYKALEKHAIPNSLPAELRARPPPARPPSRPASRPPSRPPSPQPARPPPPRASPAPPQSNAQLLEGLLDLDPSPAPAPWVVSASEKAQYDALFTRADRDRDGFVSGHEIKDTFLQSGLPQPVLAHIWALCDWDTTGKLSCEQFALAMWLVARRLRGIEPPPALAPEMVPPAARAQYGGGATGATLAQAPPPPVKTVEPPTLGPQPTPELEAIAREVDSLVRDRLTLENEVAIKERDLKVKTDENDSLQSEYDTLAATLKQLENQKGEAQKRINDMKTQVDKLSSQVSAQEAAAAETEAEVAARRAAAATLRERERGLQDDVRGAEREAEALTGQLRRLVLEASQNKLKIQHLEEQERLISEAEAGVAAALGGGGAAAHAHLALSPAFGARHLERAVRGATPHGQLDDESGDFGTINGSGGFESDPFKDSAFGGASDPFAPKTEDNNNDGFKTDAFSRAFPAGGDPFGGDAFASNAQSKADDSQDAFGSDPFAVLHAPTRADSASPTPRLPPKKHKTPPPRPAPPRPQAAFHADFDAFNKWDEPAPALPDRQRNPALDFTEDPFKDYRYEDPFNIEDPFADVTDTAKNNKLNNINNNNATAKSLDAFGFQDFSNKTTGSDWDAFARPTSVAGFEAKDAFPSNLNGNTRHTDNKRSGRVSAPIVSGFDPFARNNNNNNNNDTWATWSEDAWATDDSWSKPQDRSSGEGWANSDAWSTSDHNKNLNETWPTNTLPAPKKEKSPKPVKYARSLVHTIGGIGRRKQKPKGASETEALPSEAQQLAWAAHESRQLAAEAAERSKREQDDLQLALALSRSEK